MSLGKREVRRGRFRESPGTLRRCQSRSESCEGCRRLSHATSKPWVRSQEIWIYVWWVISPFWTLVHLSVSWEGWTRWFQLLSVLWLEGACLGQEATFEVTSATWSHGKDDVRGLSSRYTNPSPISWEAALWFLNLLCVSQQNVAISGSGVRSGPSWCEWEVAGGSHRQDGKILYGIQPTIAVTAQKNSSLKQFENDDMLSLDSVIMSMIFHEMAIRVASWTTQLVFGDGT